MDKYEYNLRNEEINALIGRREFIKAVEIADTIDWTKVRSVKTLCKISDLYKVNRRYNEAKILLEQALNRCPNGKSIVSSLCELCLRMDDIVGATEYYKLFIQLAPTDNIKFILLYKIYEAQEVTLDERIEVLEELKKRERIEKWCYELAYLYHRIGLTTRCVEECDDLILWFREGKYVKKAMELKMLHQQLTDSQDQLYQNMLDPKEREAHIEQTVVHPAVTEQVAIPETELVKTVDVGQYSTINIQKALEESIKDTLGDNPQFVAGDLVVENAEDSTVFLSDPALNGSTGAMDNTDIGDKVAEALLAPMMHDDTSDMQELFIEAANTGEIEIDETGKIPEVTEVTEVTEETITVEEVPVEEEVVNELPAGETTEEIRSQIVFPDVPASTDTIIYNKGDITNQVKQAVFGDEEAKEETPAPAVNLDTATKEELMELIDRKVAEALENAMKGQSMTSAATATIKREAPHVDAPPRSMQKMLAEELDGQISIVVPDPEPIEKQITGQINIEEFLSEWEDTKKSAELKTKESIKKKLEEETGDLFTEFEAKARDGILEKLQAEGAGDTPIDADKEYEEYLKKIKAEAGVVEETVTEEEPATEEEAPVEETPVEETPVEEPKTEEPAEEATEEAAVEEASVEEPTEEEAPEKEETSEEELPEVEEIAEVEDNVDDIPAEEPATEEEAKTEEAPVEEPAKEEAPEEKSEEPKEESSQDSDEDARALTDDELNLFAQFVQTKKAKQNLSRALDNISLASCTGNVFVTGDSGEEPIELARSVIQYAKNSDGNFSGKIGKVSGASLNGKDINVTVERMKNGGLIIEKAGDMNADTVKSLIKVLNQDNLGILIVMQDTKKEMNKMFAHFDGMKQIFNVHIEIEELSDDALVAYGRQYAEHMEYSIDEMGILALHTRIDEMQTSDHIVTVSDVRDIVDEAIEHATKFSPKHITDVLFGRRYDEDDMIILKERDFTN